MYVRQLASVVSRQLRRDVLSPLAETVREHLVTVARIRTRDREKVYNRKKRVALCLSLFLSRRERREVVESLYIYSLFLLFLLSGLSFLFCCVPLSVYATSPPAAAHVAFSLSPLVPTRDVLDELWTVPRLGTRLFLSLFFDLSLLLFLLLVLSFLFQLIRFGLFSLPLRREKNKQNLSVRTSRLSVCLLYSFVPLVLQREWECSLSANQMHSDSHLQIGKYTFVSSYYLR